MQKNPQKWERSAKKAEKTYNQQLNWSIPIVEASRSSFTFKRPENWLEIRDTKTKKYNIILNFS